MEAKKHSYSERPCMACGGAVCNMDYMDLRKQVEEKRMAPMGDVRAGIDSKPSIAKGVMKPLGRMANGGEVKGVHTPGGIKGMSGAGAYARAQQSYSKDPTLKEQATHSNQEAHKKHQAVLSELKSMKKPELYADGGMAKPEEESPVDDDKFKQFQAGLNAALGGKEAKAEEPKKKAHGGEMEDMPAGDDSDDDMIMDQCAHECMEAIEKKDKAAFKDSLHVLVADMIKKLG